MPQADGLFLIKAYLNIAGNLSPFFTENISKKQFSDHTPLTTLARSFSIFAKLSTVKNKCFFFLVKGTPSGLRQFLATEVR